MNPPEKISNWPSICLLLVLFGFVGGISYYHNTNEKVVNTERVKIINHEEVFFHSDLIHELRPAVRTDKQEILLLGKKIKQKNLPVGSYATVKITGNPKSKSWYRKIVAIL